LPSEISSICARNLMNYKKYKEKIKILEISRFLIYNNKNNVYYSKLKYKNT